MNFTTITLGCKVNLYESESLISHLVQKGWNYAKNSEKMDVVIINTCTVTSTSDQKSRQMIRQARKKYPSAIIVAMGCFVQTHSKDAIQLADIVVGTSDRLKIYDLVNQYLEKHHQINHILNLDSFVSYEEMKLNNLTIHTRGFIKIQDGCENFCSYCLIPYARGKIKSRLPENIIAEIEQLVMLGTKEIIISGINTGAYGRDLGYINLAKLIEMIVLRTNIWRIRISSIELMEVTDEFLQIMEKYQNRIAMHLHIPLQGGNDATLKRMHRKYLTKDYANLLQKIRQIFPDIAITTDCLAGFVGETEEDFLSSMEFIKQMQFSNMHIFPYSRRKGTLADQMDGHLDNNIIKERALKLIEIAKESKIAYEKRFINRTMDVLFEQKKDNYWIGHTSNYLEIFCKAMTNDNLSNKIYQCKIIEQKNDKLYAILMEEKR